MTEIIQDGESISIKTININDAVNTLRTGNCICLNATNAGWGDTELCSIIWCMMEGHCNKLVELHLAGNNFSQDATKILCAAIGPNALPAAVAAQNQNPQQLN